MVVGRQILKSHKEKFKVGIVDYGMGNLYSVIGAFEYIGSTVELIYEPDQILEHNNLILPGVGSFRMGMDNLSDRGLDVAIIDSVLNKRSKILGICLGMQLLGSSSTEDGYTNGLGLLPNKVEEFNQDELSGKKLPHTGFNSISYENENSFFVNLPNMSDFYFIHSYRMIPNAKQKDYATCNYGVDFLAAIKFENIYGAQFHPEKSQTNGLTLLKNFLTESL